MLRRPNLVGQSGAAPTWCIPGFVTVLPPKRERSRRVLRLYAAPAAVVLALVGCAGSGPSSSGTSGVGDTTEPAAGATVAKSREWTTLVVRVEGVGVAVSCRGEARDRPPVVFVSGIGLGAKAGWIDSGVPDQVAATTRVCAYDRPGLGVSDPAVSARSIANQVKELAALLVAVDITEPVVLVAQGYGTLIAREFATPKSYLTEVAGLVLIDPPLWPLFDAPSPDSSSGERAEFESLADVNTSLGRYGAGAMAPPPVPVVVVTVDGERANRPGQPVVRPAFPAGTLPETTTSPPGTAPPVGGTVPPDLATPGTATPDPATPGTATPDSATPESATPDPAAPETVTPESGTPETAAEPPGTSPATLPPLIPPASDRVASQRQLVAKGTFATMVELTEAGSEAQFWLPDRVAAIIVGLLTDQ